MNCQDFNNLIKLSDFLHFNEIWPMFPPNPMYETNAIQLHFLLWFFWYISQWSDWICSIFCTLLNSKDIHCGRVSYCLQWFNEFSFSIPQQQQQQQQQNDLVGSYLARQEFSGHPEGMGDSGYMSHSSGGAGRPRSSSLKVRPLLNSAHWQYWSFLKIVSR